ncbi:replication initiator protein [Klebsiella pneumoniae]
MGSCAAPSAKGDDKFITTDYLQQCRLLLPGINAFTRCRSLTSIALSGSRIVTANQTDS